ncbi:MAG: YbaB/EbfC family nucleoid-associated protein [Dehalococcoidia bacterium]
MNKKIFLRQAQEMAAKLTKAQEEMEDLTVEASSGGGAVRVVLSGKLEVLEVHISPDAVDPEDVELLQDLVMTAVNEAVQKAQELAQSRMGDLTGGLNIPGLM